MTIELNRPAAATVTVAVSGELDLASAPELNDALFSAGAEHANVLLDLTAVTFVDSTALAVLLAHRRAARARGARLRVVGAQINVQRMLDLAGVTDVLTLAAA